MFAESISEYASGSNHDTVPYCNLLKVEYASGNGRLLTSRTYLKRDVPPTRSSGVQPAQCVVRSRFVQLHSAHLTQGESNARWQSVYAGLIFSAEVLPRFGSRCSS